MRGLESTRRQAPEYSQKGAETIFLHACPLHPAVIDLSQRSRYPHMPASCLYGVLQPNYIRPTPNYQISPIHHSVIPMKFVESADAASLATRRARWVGVESLTFGLLSMVSRLAVEVVSPKRPKSHGNTPVHPPL